jgi:Sulfotransferase family
METDLKFKPNGDCIFIHIPKTAGISIYKSVLDLKRPFDWFFGLDKKYLKGLLKNQVELKKIHVRVDKAIESVKLMMKESKIEDWPTEGASMLGHIHYKALIDDGKLSQEYFNNAFKFAFVRNPYDRLVSLYKYHMVQKRAGLDFDKFVETLSQEFQEGNVPEVGLYNIRPFPMTSPLYHIQIYGNQYQPMVAWLPKEHVMIFYLETFEQDIDRMLSVMGFEGKRAPVPKKNKSKYDDNFMDFYSNRQTIDLVNKIYKEDFETFGYDML